jgi:hypothetical protein
MCSVRKAFVMTCVFQCQCGCLRTRPAFGERRKQRGASAESGSFCTEGPVSLGSLNVSIGFRGTITIWISSSLTNSLANREFPALNCSEKSLNNSPASHVYANHSFHKIGHMYLPLFLSAFSHRFLIPKCELNRRSRKLLYNLLPNSLQLFQPFDSGVFRFLKIGQGPFPVVQRMPKIAGIGERRLLASFGMPRATLGSCRLFPQEKARDMLLVPNLCQAIEHTRSSVGGSHPCRCTRSGVSTNEFGILKEDEMLI